MGSYLGAYSITRIWSGRPLRTNDRTNRNAAPWRWTIRGMKRDICDDLFSKLIRERAGWNCESCGKNYEHRTQGLHCSHFFSRRHKSTRWDPENAAAHCFGCHQRLGGNPIDFTTWIKGHLGVCAMAALRLRAHQTVKIDKTMKKQITEHLRGELKRIQELRNNGATGRLEFEGYEFD